MRWREWLGIPVCHHKWELRTAKTEASHKLRGPIWVTRVLYVCSICSKPRTRTIPGEHSIEDLAVVTDNDLDRVLDQTER